MDLTARENIYLNGAIMGYDRAFMKRKFDEIVDFSELQAFLDVPLKNFSSGMVVRLGFSVASNVHAEILIVDEILPVSDAAFQEKCENRMNDLLQNGTTLIFVSHSAEQVRKLCQRAVWLEHGQVQMQGNSAEVCDAYHAFLAHA